MESQPNIFSNNLEFLLFFPQNTYLDEKHFNNESLENEYELDNIH